MIGAIVRRDLIGGGRTVRSFATRWVFLGIVAAIALYGLSAEVRRVASQRPADPAELLMPIAILQMTLIALIAPALGVAAGARDRASGAAELMRAAGVRRRERIAGGFLSTMAVLALYAASTLPLLALWTLIGGSGAALVAGILGETLAVAASGTAIGLSAAAIAGGRMPSLVLAYGVMALLLFGDAAFVWLVIPQAMAGSGAVGALAALSPYFTLFAMWNGGVAVASVAVESVLLQLALAAIALVPALVFGDEPGESRAALARTGVAMLDGRPADARRTTRPSRAVDGNPIAWRDARAATRSFGLRLMRLAFVALGGGASVLVAVFATIGGWQDGARFTILLLLIGAALVALVTSASAITSEKESGTMALLSLSELDGLGIVVAKLEGVWRFLWPIVPVVLVPAVIWVGVDDDAMWKVPLTVALVLAWASGIGLLCSARFRRTQVAVSVAIGAALVWTVGAPLLMDWMSIGTDANVALADPPAAAMFALLPCGNDRDGWRADVSWPTAAAGLAIGGAAGGAAMLLAGTRLDETEALA